MDWTVWMLFVLTEGVLTATPGPAVLFVVSQGLRCRSDRALLPVVGILSANALYFALSGTGVGALLVASGRLFTVVKWAGAAYLVYLGVTALVHPRPLDGAGESPAEIGSTGSALFLRGVVLQLSNPKALLFFVAILPQFVDRNGPIVVQLVVLGVTSIVLELAVLSAYGIAASRAARIFSGTRFATATGRLSGALLVGAGLGLARLER